MNDFDLDEESEVNSTKEKLPSGTLYFMQETDYLTGERFDYYKIGIVKGDRDVFKREKEHRTGNPRQILAIVEIETPAVQLLETHLHNIFARHRVSSGEWFHLPEEKFKQVLGTAQQFSEVLKQNHAAILKHSEANKVEHSAPMLAPTEETAGLVRDIVGLATELARVEGLKKKISAVLLEKAGANSEFEYLFQESITNESTKFDGTGLKKAEAALYKTFMTKESASWNKKYLVSIDEEPSGALDLDHLPDLPALDVHGHFLAAWSEAAQITWNIRLLEARLLQIMNDASGVEGLVVWSQLVKKVFDKDAFIEAHPEIFQQFQKTSPEVRRKKVVEWASYARA